MKQALRILAFLSLTLTLCPRDAAAWNGNVHTAIIRVARRLSPAFESRIPVTEIEEVMRGASAADPLDLICASHRGDREDLEAWNQAALVLRELRTPRAERTERMEAFLIGQ